MTNGQILFRAVRALLRASQDGLATSSEHGRMIMLVEAINAVNDGSGATVNDIADYIGIDQSGASRLVTQAIAAGYVVRERSAHDARVRHCTLTATGTQLLQDALAWQDATFNHLTADWTAQERQEFSTYLHRIVLGSDRVSTNPVKKSG